MPEDQPTFCPAQEAAQVDTDVQLSAKTLAVEDQPKAYSHLKQASVTQLRWAAAETVKQPTAEPDQPEQTAYLDHLLAPAAAVVAVTTVLPTSHRLPEAPVVEELSVMLEQPELQTKVMPEATNLRTSWAAAVVVLEPLDQAQTLDSMAALVEPAYHRQLRARASAEPVVDHQVDTAQAQEVPQPMAVALAAVPQLRQQMEQ